VFGGEAGRWQVYQGQERVDAGGIARWPENGGGGTIAEEEGEKPGMRMEEGKNFRAEIFHNLFATITFAPQNRLMDYRQEEFREELEKVQDRDFTHSWVSSSAFLFYLSVFCFVAFAFGSCLKLYTKKFDHSKPQNVVVQESSQYTPKYSTPK
jgi:hypothetical protein